MHDFTYYPKKERLSWIIFAFIMLAVWFVPKYLFPEKEIPPGSHFSTQLIDSLILLEENQHRPSNDITNRDKERNKSGKYARAGKTGKRMHAGNAEGKSRFAFDPNTAPEDSLRLILPRYAAQNLIKYRNSGGVFRYNRDLLRIYGLDSAIYLEIEPYLRITSGRIKNGGDKRFVKTGQGQGKSIQAIEVNAADTNALKTLPGVGSVLARRIVSFRDALGGFYHIGQVAETYGLPEETFQRIKGRLELGKPHRRIRINTATEKVLSAHPYIQWKQARAMYLYRREHGPYGQLEDLYWVRSLDSAFVRKVAPYLDFEAASLPPGDSINSRRGGQ